MARIRHPNVMPTIDLVEDQGELFIVMEYLAGEALSTVVRALRKRKKRFPPALAAARAAAEQKCANSV